mmetsp:Transcript_83192/g.131282  ORF Transcript_83192/g.131282 Transcript_83192/m.131282 type:complete len:140 (-) Transcript_83192:16-435(-)
MNGERPMASKPFIPMKKLRSNSSGASFLSITETNANKAAEASDRQSPKGELVTAFELILLGDCKETNAQPAKLHTAALKEHHLNGSRQISSEKKKVNTEVVDESTVLVATDVYKRLKLKIHCAQSHNKPIEAESRATSM